MSVHIRRLRLKLEAEPARPVIIRTVWVPTARFDPGIRRETGKAVKCDFCMERVDQGLNPACVTVCTTHCLQFGAEVDEIVSVRKRRHAEAVAALDTSTN